MTRRYFSQPNPPDKYAAAIIAAECLALARHLGMISEADCGVEFAAIALDGLDPSLVASVAEAQRWDGKLAVRCAKLEGTLDRLVAAHKMEAANSEPREPPARKRQRKPSRKAIIERAKKAGATSVTVDGVTLKFAEPELSDIERELAAFEARHGKA